MERENGEKIEIDSRRTHFKIHHLLFLIHLLLFIHHVVKLTCLTSKVKTEKQTN